MLLKMHKRDPFPMGHVSFHGATGNAVSLRATQSFYGNFIDSDSQYL